jgi:hypothetical protein
VETVPIVIENALLVVNRPIAMTVFGELDPANLNAVRAGSAVLDLAFSRLGWRELNSASGACRRCLGLP